MLPGVGVFFFRRPARRYHHETVGGLVLGGAATVAYRPAVRRYVYAAAGGLLLGGSATVRYRSAPARKIWAADEIFALADDDLDALLLDGDEAHLLLAKDTAMDVERLVHRDAEGRITKITSHERDDTDRLADQVRRLVRQGIGVDAEGRFTLPVSAEMDESRLVYIVNSLRDRLQEGPADGCPRILTWKRDDPEPATARAAASARKPLGPIGFTSTR